MRKVHQYKAEDMLGCETCHHWFFPKEKSWITVDSLGMFPYDQEDYCACPIDGGRAYMRHDRDLTPWFGPNWKELRQQAYNAAVPERKQLFQWSSFG